MRSRLLIGLVVATAMAGAVAYAVNGSRRTHQNTSTTCCGPHSSGAITGHVLTPDGQAAAGASVWAVSGDFTTGRLPVSLAEGQGAFLIKNLAPGTYKVFASKEGEGYAPTDSTFYNDGLVVVPEITVSEKQTASDVTVYLGPKAARLVGRVMNAQTRGQVKNAQITLHRVDNPSASLLTGPGLDGRFNILVPPTLVKVEVAAPGYQKKLLGTLVFADGEKHSIDVPLLPAN